MEFDFGVSIYSHPATPPITPAQKEVGCIPDIGVKSKLYLHVEGYHLVLLFFSITDNKENDLDLLERILRERKQDVSIYMFSREDIAQVRILDVRQNIS